MMEAREVLTQLGCDRHSYLADGVYCGIDLAGQIWLITRRDHMWHQVALDDVTLSALFNYVKAQMKGIY